jgi:hypothetical protein
VDEVSDIQVIAYDRKRKFVMRRKTKKRRLMLDNTLLITTKETHLNTKNAKTIELIGEGIAITDAMLDLVNMDEKELATTKKEMDHVHHLAKYYQDSMQAVIFPRSEFRETYAQFTSEINLFTTCIVDFQ